MMDSNASVQSVESSVASQTPQRTIKSVTGGTLIPWAPGKSGNPSGRSRRFHEVQEAARDQSLDAINKLAVLMESEDERVQIIACNSILDRAFGKPKEQKTEDNQSVRPNLAALTPEQLGQFRTIMQALAGAAQQTQDVGNVAPIDATAAQHKE